MKPLLVLAACAALLAACASTPSAPPADPAAVQVTVLRDGDVWTVEYRLPSDAPVWAFRRSALTIGDRRPWRPQQWTPTTPGVVFDRAGHLDVLRTVDGGPVPRRLRFRYRPASLNLEADYDPALVFTDGSVAVYSGHFDLFPLASLAEAAALPHDLNEAAIVAPDARITWRSHGRVLVEGERRRNPTTVHGGLYALFGPLRPTEGEALVAAVDPQMPGWIRDEIAGYGPRVAQVYAGRLGAGQTARPTVMAAWRGPTPGVRSMGGSVLSGLIVMSFEGQVLLQSSPEMTRQIRWFVGHEAAHFWLGQTVRYEFGRDAWIMEGGADLMAIRALAALDSAYDARAELQAAVDDCGRLAVQPVVGALQRGELRATYACGAVFALVAEGVHRRAHGGGDWFDVLRPLIDANRADGVLTRDEWLDALDAASGDPALRAIIETLLDQGSPAAPAVIADLLALAGVPHALEDGKPVLR